jgi:ribosomal 50S subunit-associated protein YjgA (DUF615 family)
MLTSHNYDNLNFLLDKLKEQYNQEKADLEKRYNVDKDLIFQSALTGQVEEFMEAAGYKGNIKL